MALFPGMSYQGPLGSTFEGFNLIQQAQQARNQHLTDSIDPNATPNVGYHPGPEWDVFFNALGKGPVKGLKMSRGIEDDPTSSFNTAEGPFGQFGAGTGGADAAMNGLKKAAPTPWSLG